MTAEGRAAVLVATREFLKALSGLTLNAKIGFGEIRALLKLVYVQEAHEQAQSRGEGAEPNVTRISTVTGLSRAEVTSLLSQADDEMPLVKRGRSRADAVLEGWRSDRKFLDRNTGTPAVLTRRRFKELVREHSGDGSVATAILNELVNGGAAAISDGDTIRFLRPTCATVGLSTESAAHLNDAAIILRALVHNLEHREAPHYVRTIRCDGLDADETTTALPEVFEAADDFSESARVTLHHARPQSRKSSNRGQRKNVTVLIQIVSEATKPEKPHKQTRSPRNPLRGPKSRAKHP